MTARPLFGLSTSQPMDPSLGRLFNGTSRHYAEGLERVGALPLLLPNVPELADEYAERVDAVLLTGGVDIHPRHFGEAPRAGLGVVDEERDEFETALYRTARELGKPVFGICRGMQLINVLEGGTLHQHLPAVAGVWADHSQQSAPPTLSHEVQVVPGSVLAGEYGDKTMVNSFHHQAIARLAPTLRVSATAPDGVIEAVEGQGLLAVQWHPELLLPRYEMGLGVFRAFLRVLNA